jgi:hypothetical protein
MRNDSIESLLLRHYGNDAPAPPGLETRLVASVRQEAAEMREQESLTARLGKQRMSRRAAVRWVALGTAGLSIVSMGLESLQTLEASLAGQDVMQTAYP